MKRFFLLLLSLVTVLPLLFSCRALPAKDARPTIVATNFPLYDFAKTLTQEDACVKLLLPPGADLHSYEPTPQDLATLSSCDLILWMGGESERHLQKLFSSLNGVETLALAPLFSEECKEDEHAHHSHTDEHYWTSPKKARVMFDAVAEKLRTLLPNASDAILARQKEYQDSLLCLDAAYHEAASTLPTLIIGDAFPFTHLAHDYNLKYAAATDGCGEDSEPSAARLTELIDLARKNGTKTIFYTETSDGKFARTIAKEVFLCTARLHSCHNLSAEEYDQGETYLSLMNENLNTLKNA